MSETKHTPEPWRLAASHERSEFGCEPEIVGPAHVDVDECEFVAVVCEGLNATEANAHRIVACVNALAGVEEPEAELARLRVIEAAARAYVEADPDRVDMGPLYDALEQAVGR